MNIHKYRIGPFAFVDVVGTFAILYVFPTAVLSENGTLQDPFVFVCEHARNMGRARHKYDIR
jgi:hypothetical protein